MSKTKSLEELSAIVSECLPDVREYGKNREKRENRKNRKSEHEKTLQDIFLETLCENEIPICVFLVSGIKLQGYLDNFDQKVLVLKNSKSCEATRANFLISATPIKTAEEAINFAWILLAMICASVVLPTPGGPQNIKELKLWCLSICSSILPEPKICSWPT